MICLNDNKVFKRFYKMLDFFNDSYKAYYLQFNELIILFSGY